MSARPIDPKPGGIRPRRKNKYWRQDDLAQFNKIAKEMAAESMANALSDDLPSISGNGPFLTEDGKIGGPFADFKFAAPGTAWKRPGDPPGVTWVRGSGDLDPNLDTSGWVEVTKTSIAKSQPDPVEQTPPAKPSKYGRMIRLEMASEDNPQDKSKDKPES